MSEVLVPLDPETVLYCILVTSDLTELVPLLFFTILKKRRNNYQTLWPNHMDNTIYSMTQYDIRYTTSDYDVMKTPPRGIANRKKDLPGDKMSGVQVSGEIHRYPVWQASWQTAERLT